MCVHVIVHKCRIHNTAQNSSDNLPSYRPDNHHCSCLYKSFPHRPPSNPRTDSTDFTTGPFLCLVPCGRLSWLLVSFWAHVNIVHHIIYIISYHIYTNFVHWVIKFASPVSRLRQFIVAFHTHRLAEQRSLRRVRWGLVSRPSWLKICSTGADVAGAQKGTENARLEKAGQLY